LVVTNKIPSLIPGSPRSQRSRILTSVICNAYKRDIRSNHAHSDENPDDRTDLNPIQSSKLHPIPFHSRETAQDAANVSLPSLCKCQRAPGKPRSVRPNQPARRGRRLLVPPTPTCQRDYTPTPIFFQNILTC
jgi:hypothetical protein